MTNRCVCVWGKWKSSCLVLDHLPQMWLKIVMIHDTSFWCDSWLESERVINDRLNRRASLATNQYEIVEQILNMSIWLMEGNKHVSMRKEDNMEWNVWSCCLVFLCWKMWKILGLGIIKHDNSIWSKKLIIWSDHMTISMILR